MKINCTTVLDGWLGEPPPGQEKETVCGKPAVILILSTCLPVMCRGTLDGVHRTESVELTIANGFCEQHAAEEVHEARTSMSEDEYVIVNLAAEHTLEKVRRYAVAMTDSVSVANRGVASDVIEIINGDVPAAEFEGGCAS